MTRLARMADIHDGNEYSEGTSNADPACRNGCEPGALAKSQGRKIHMMWHRRFLCLPILALAAAVAGCQSSSEGQLSCGEECTAACVSDPLIIMIGADRDIAMMGQLRQVTADLRDCGYNAVYFDPWKQLNDDELLADMIRNAVKCRGQRVMLVGWSYGAVVGLKALQHVKSEGICVDTFVELDCFSLNYHMAGDINPSNVGRIIVIRSDLNSPVAGYCHPEVHRLNTYWHLGVPTDQHTRTLLVSEASRLRGAASQNELLQSLPEVSHSDSVEPVTRSPFTAGNLSTPE